MILPIRIYGDPVLRAETQEVTGPGEALSTLISDMTVTMHRASGIGLAAPQVGRRERLFLVDLSPLLADLDEEEREAYPLQPMVFINPRICWESPEEVEYEEGCLSIPDVREAVFRPERVRISYRDHEFSDRSLEVGGLLSRVIQHEYDHLEGILFVDLISPFRRTLLKRRLREMARGEVEADYEIAVYQGGSAGR